MKEKTSFFRSHRKKIIGAACLIVVLTAGYAYFNKGSGVTYLDVKAGRQSIITFYNYTGNIESDNTQTVYANSSQPVKKFHVSAGDMVKKGDLLVEFKNDNLESALAQSRASLAIAQVNYEKAVGTGKTEKTMQIEKALATAEMSLKKAETNYDRVKQLFAHEASAQTELDDARDAYESALITYKAARSDHDFLETTLSQDFRTATAQLEQAKASLANYEAQYADSKIYAEISGKVTEIFVSENRQIAMGTKILDLIDYDSLKVDIKVDEYGLAAAKVGKKADVYFNALNLRVQGTISKISESATVENGVSYFPATISLGKDENLRVGMSVEVNVIKDFAQDVIAIPMRAVSLAADRSAFVQIRDESGKIVDRPVMVGINNGMLVEIRQGLEEGETISFKADSVSVLPATSNQGARSGTVMMPGPGAGQVRIQQQR